MSISVEQVSMGHTAWLRSRVLRPGWTPAQVLEHDDPGAVQVAAMADGLAMACANIRPDPAPWDPSGAGWWRIRGVATDPAWRRQGLAAQCVTACCDHAVLEGATRVWCNARVGALGLYDALGWTGIGERFELPEIGEHLRMWRALA